MRYNTFDYSPYLLCDSEIKPNVYLEEGIYSINQIQNNLPARIINNSAEEVVIDKDFTVNAMQFIPNQEIQTIESVMKEQLRPLQAKIQQIKSNNLKANKANEQISTEIELKDVDLPDYMQSISINSKLSKQEQIK